MLQTQSFQIPDLHAAYEDGLSPLSVVEEVYRRIETVADEGIFLHLMDKQAVRAECAALGAFDPLAKPLWGIPFAIKDNIDAKNAPTTAACPAFAYDAEEDAFVVAILRAAGAILIGKTNLDQFATGLVGVRTPYAAPRNALDPDIVPGGSSSGSAVAVAHGLVTFALGTDTAGSGRIPAGLNGIVGLKPTIGAISASGVIPACRTLDTVSIFALSVEEAHEVLQVAARFDPADAYARPIPVPPLGRPAPAFTVGVPDPASRQFFGDETQAISFSEVLDDITALGGTIVEMDFEPLYQVANMLYNGAWVAERYTVIEDLLRDNPKALFPATRQIIQAAETLSAADVFRGFYRLQDLKRLVAPLIQSVDMFCVPTLPTFVTVEELKQDPVTPNTRLGTYTNFVNLLDLCGIAVPTQPRRDGRPGSVTLLSGAGQDGQIATLASALHRRCGGMTGATGWALADAKPIPPKAGAGEIALAAVGAHMSGLPLNGELTKLGARFLFAGQTAPEYKLYSLPGGPPHRPGLIRDPGGTSIALEVWAVPTDQVGAFLSGIPHPLGIGTVTLEDGSQVKGFICEPIGIEGAMEVTEHGGWRAYLQSLS
ncbi:allophanate hydrolase [Magnetospira sp. QH-2]|uniref:allophanate hydrolase n=1 Tax=Magnetospira sp. (strain QH-2) TaxID=1288970 RepID=UPI0003E8170D|nr:allophanate hydrolase [Magnetospira sp. QH-2]CCQ72541.1 putative amidase [Magnetospira sp. QH-2]